MVSPSVQIKQYLRAYAAYWQDGWFDWLPIAEIALNHHVNASTGMMPIFRYLRMNLEPLVEPETSAQQRLNLDEADKFATSMEVILDQLPSNLRTPQLRQTDYADPRWAPAPAYRVGDEVYLDTRNLRTTCPSKKLDHTFLGPFAITKVFNSVTYRLVLLLTMEIHPVFHTSLLLRAYSDPRDRHQLPPDSDPNIINSDGDESTE